MSGIEERLRGENWWLNVSGEEAADEIATLHSHLDHRSDVNTALRAEIERLSAALREIADEGPKHRLDAETLVAIARAALEGK